MSAETPRVRPLETVGNAIVGGRGRYLANLVERLPSDRLTSDSEGVPLALMEAMATGIAVVATQVGAVAEIVGRGDSGVRVPAHQPRAVATEVLRLLADPSVRAALGAAAQHRIATLFNLADGLPLHAVPSVAVRRRASP